jgi:hypothetical protein
MMALGDKRQPRDWLQISASVALLLGLILVGIQINQSNAIAGAELLNTNIESTISREIALFGESPDESMHRVLFEPERATTHDYFVAERVYNTIQKQLTRAHLFASAGLYGVGIATPDGFVRGNFRLYACPYGIASIDQVLASLPADSPMRPHAVTMRELAANYMAAKPMTDRIARTESLLEELRRQSP